MSDEFNTRHEVRQTIAAPAWMFLPRTPLRRGLTSVATRKLQNHAAGKFLVLKKSRSLSIWKRPLRKYGAVISHLRFFADISKLIETRLCMRPAQVILQVAGEVCRTVTKDEERFREAEESSIKARMKGSLRGACGAQEYLALTFLFNDVDENINVE
ncbi:hypothetical protein ALC62_11767 [Cyphomyrmex costatus]|uniref:Uncharacterized protein n=1 Tax=Cyphomyrmex costatus TaxID=456900 RepID=A0A195C9T6_9HYME|nr:hypothetical protein ALC62_11767 [Cyphomyrmex costatus]